MAFYATVEMVDLPDAQWPSTAGAQLALVRAIHVHDWDFCWEFEVFLDGPYRFVECFEVETPVGHRAYDVWQGDDSLVLVKPVDFRAVLISVDLRVVGQAIEASFALASGRCIAVEHYLREDYPLMCWDLEETAYEAVSEEGLIDSSGQHVELCLPGCGVGVPRTAVLWADGAISQAALDARLAGLRPVRGRQAPAR